MNIKWKVVTFHHSIYSVASHANDTSILQRRDEYAPVFKEFGIDVVLMGHDHVYTRSHIMDGLTPIVQYEEDGSVPGEYINPEGTLYLTVNSASGSKYYGILNQQFQYAAVKNQERTPNFTNVVVTDTSFEATTYRTHDKSVVDTVKLIKEAEKPTVVSVEQPLPIEVEYKTAVESIVLPEKVVAKLSDESSRELDVIWSMEEYNGELPGEQEFIGSYNLPEDIVGDKPEVKITIKVLEKEKPTVVSVEQPLPIEVEYGTAIENIALPKKIIAKLSNESSMELDVIWSTEEYNGELPGEQEFIGSYNLPEDVVGDKPEVKIIIKVSEDEEHNTANVTFMWMQPGMDNVIVKADIKGRVIPPEINFLDGYRFAGWYRNINYFGDEIDFKSEVFISDTVVYAKWIKIESEKPVIEEPESQGGFWLLFSGIGQSSTYGGDNKPEQELSVTERVKDINGHWAEFAIRAVVRKGLMDVEKDEFKPNVATSRMEIIMGLAKLNKVELNINTGKVFKDIKENSAEAAAIQWAVNSNIVDGYEDGTFHPNKAVSREEMAKILVLYVEHVKHEVEFEASPGFNDEDSVGDWAKEYVKKSREMKLLMGREDGSFDPSATLTKGEVAQLIYRLMK